MAAALALLAFAAACTPDNTSGSRRERGRGDGKQGPLLPVGGSPAPEDPARRACEAIVAVRSAAAASVGLVEARPGEAARGLAYGLGVLREVVPFFLSDQPDIGRPLRDFQRQGIQIRAALPDEVPERLAHRTIRAGTALFRETMSDCAGVTSLPRIQVRPAGVPFAEADGLTLVLPTPEPVLVGFHESLVPEALSLEPIGSLELNDNPGKFSPPPDRDGPGYVILAGRERTTSATSSADVALDPGAPIFAPLSGEIVSVDDYILYCEAPDQRVMIAPDANPDVRLVVLHIIVDEAIEEGDRAVAGRTLLGTPRVYPEAHPQIDSYLDGDYPHTHIEIDAIPNPPLPGC